MSDVNLSGWLAIFLSLATPLFAFLGAIAGHWWARRSATELDTWHHREETMRLLRWAVELAAGADDPRAWVGIATLSALRSSELLQPEDLELVAAVTDAVLAEPAQAYAELTEGIAPDDVEIIEE